MNLEWQKRQPEPPDTLDTIIEALHDLTLRVELMKLGPDAPPEEYMKLLARQPGLRCAIVVDEST